MLIKSLRMENFRQFRGTSTIEFSCDQERNVTIILGDNTYGKTTLLQAFNWCFYGSVLFDTNPDLLLNLEVADKMVDSDKQIVEVEICVFHENTEYVISRTQQYTCHNKKIRGNLPQPKVSHKQSDGQMKAVSAREVDNVINNILPQDLSTYFFFDTERVRTISTRKDVAEAVRGLLGLSVIESAMKHLGSKSSKSTVIGKLYAALDIDGDKKAQDALNRIQSGEEKRQVLAERLETYKSEIKNYEIRIEQIEAVLRDNQTTSRLQKQKEDFEKKVHSEEKALLESENTYLKLFSDGSIEIFAQPLLKRAKAFLKEVKVDDKGVKDLTRPTIIELIQRGRCICGAEIVNGNHAHQLLEQELNFVPPESIGNTVRHYREKLDSLLRPAHRTIESLQAIKQEIFRSRNRIQEWNAEISEIVDQIKGKESMSKYESELGDFKQRLRGIIQKKEALIRDDAALENSIASYKKVYDSLIAVSDKNRLAMEQIRYAEEIFNWLNKIYIQKEEEIRTALEVKVNSIFEKMYHGHRRVAIDNKYQVSLLATISDTEIASGESEGSNRVKNFAFIAGLVSLAKDKIVQTGIDQGFQLSSESYPLVMDAPFSNADETHTANISKILPEIAEQVIMFVMQKDWRYAEPVMSSRVGKQYQLNKISETNTQLK